ncbi:hypothetical protein BDK51DRAFT_44192 [Blyttiomyces helicus]|uniref:Receptor ligand binding region domain-containing protein n=1 Tax=Blyttiomyces helicus TaxID=388810 RepID=A0A4V1IPK6_9FUNG|nr:hypothetical protein BDK51DRAFT_44192 [Blyttiomyces helicus]|eukprot:RKO83387.1 hypothetical protein BDK51DRAFT_44192 [Blyttiomyces helicus]
MVEQSLNHDFEKGLILTSPLEYGGPESNGFVNLFQTRYGFYPGAYAAFYVSEPTLTRLSDMATFAPLPASLLPRLYISRNIAVSRLSDVRPLPQYDAVFAIAYGLRSIMTNHGLTVSSIASNTWLALNVSMAEFATSFTGITGPVKFSAQGERVDASYVIWNSVNGTLVDDAHDNGLTLVSTDNRVAIFYSGNSTPPSDVGSATNSPTSDASANRSLAWTLPGLWALLANVTVLCARETSFSTPPDLSQEKPAGPSNLDALLLVESLKYLCFFTAPALANCSPPTAANMSKDVTNMTCPDTEVPNSTDKEHTLDRFFEVMPKTEWPFDATSKLKV